MRYAVETRVTENGTIAFKVREALEGEGPSNRVDGTVHLFTEVFESKAEGKKHVDKYKTARGQNDAG